MAGALQWHIITAQSTLISAKQTDKCMFRVCIKVMHKKHNFNTLVWDQTRAPKEHQWHFPPHYCQVTHLSVHTWTLLLGIYDCSCCCWVRMRFREMPWLRHLTPRWTVSPETGTAHNSSQWSSFKLNGQSSSTTYINNDLRVKWSKVNVSLREIQVETDHYRDCEREKRSSIVISANSIAQFKLFLYLSIYAYFFILRLTNSCFLVNK